MVRRCPTPIGFDDYLREDTHYPVTIIVGSKKGDTPKLKTKPVTHTTVTPKSKPVTTATKIGRSL
jgi:hypothetical protein